MATKILSVLFILAIAASAQDKPRKQPTFSNKIHLYFIPTFFDAYPSDILVEMTENFLKFKEIKFLGLKPKNFEKKDPRSAYVEIEFPKVDPAVENPFQEQRKQLLDHQSNLIEMRGVYAVEMEGGIRYQDGTPIEDILAHKQLLVETSPLRKKTMKRQRQMRDAPGVKFDSKEDL